MNSINHRLSKPLAIVAGIFGVLSCARAQHYVPGTEGIRAATLPPPGFYLQDYNFYSWSDNVLYPPSTIPFSPYNRAQIYLNEPRLIWISDWKILGANFGMDLIVPFKRVQTTYGQSTVITPAGTPVMPPRESHSGLADIQFEPILLSWHPKHFDFSAGYGFWAPTGNYSINHNVNVGEGFWTHMFTLGGTWYPDDEKTWALSLLNHFELNSPNYDSSIPDSFQFNPIGRGGSPPILVPGSPRYTEGDTYTLECGASKILFAHFEFGGVGYYQKQVTGNRGPIPGPLETVALGPEIRSSWPRWGFTASLRYDCEIYAQNQAPSKLLALMLAERF